MTTQTPLPRGFRAHAGSIGIKDDTADFTVIASDTPATAVGMYTKSRFAGCSVRISREATADNQLRAIAVVSKNSNVATGPEGEANARELVASVAQSLGVNEADVAIASTGVIGRQYPMERVRSYLATLEEHAASSVEDAFGVTDAGPVAEAIMTTDTHAKIASASIASAGTGSASTASARIVGVAKGVGMIEPDMATMLTFIFTDAEIASDALDPIVRRVIDRTFNAVSVDTDTSTSDTAIVMANGSAGAVDLAEFETALFDVALSLTKMIASDGEGAETLIEVRVDSARDVDQARRVAKAIVNSPLVKTAVHGADPNWGRVAMAIGKCSDDLDIDQEAVTIRFGDTEVYPTLLPDTELETLSAYLANDEVLIHVSLGIDGKTGGEFTAYGCDLTDGYVRINADYTT